MTASNRGVVLFAHNNETTDYYKMAAYTAARITKFLNLPVTVITDENSITCDYPFDKIITRTPDTSNWRKDAKWINKGRYEVYQLSPYEDTIVLDTDYLVNSHRLLRLFEFDTDFMCHRNCKFLMNDTGAEQIGSLGPQTYWATVIRFTKTQRAEQIFNMVEMIQDNYQHYTRVYNFNGAMYRNDYALTIALRTINGQTENRQDFIPWNLLHVASDSMNVVRISDTQYKISREQDGKKTHIIVDDCDFHMINKTNFMELAV